MRNWVGDASPIILLTKVGQSHLLTQLPDQFVIPASVADEVQAGPPGDAARQWMLEVGKAFVEPVSRIPTEVASWDLGRGETEVLSWAYQDPAWTALIDDQAARRCAQTLDIHCTGTIGVVLAAKQEGVLGEVGPVIDTLRDAGLRIHPDVIAEALRLANE